MRNSELIRYMRQVEEGYKRLQLFTISPALKAVLNLAEQQKPMMEAARKLAERNYEIVKATMEFSSTMNSHNIFNYSINIPNIYFSIPSIKFQEIERALVKVNEIVFNQYQPNFIDIVRSSTENMALHLRKFVADISSFQIAAENILESKKLKVLFENIQVDGETGRAFRISNWPIAPHMPKELKIKVLDYYQNGKVNKISNVIIGYYQRNNWELLKETVESWKDRKYFDHRSQIFNDALEAHENKKFTLSIPALFPQVEGILNEYVHENNLNARLGKITKVYEAAIGDIEDYPYKSWIIAETLLEIFKKSTFSYTDFSEELNRSVNNRKANRHTFLHGIATKNYSLSNSLKIFLLLDALTVLRDLEE